MCALNQEIAAAARKTSENEHCLQFPRLKTKTKTTAKTKAKDNHIHTGCPKKNALSECSWSHNALAQSQVAGTPCVWKLIFWLCLRGAVKNVLADFVR